MTSRPLRLLVVDDEPLVTRSLERVLSRAGFAVQRAGGGAEALQALESGVYDLVLCDVRMPVVDGPAVLKHLVAQPSPPPLVFLTGYGEVGDEALLGLGARAVLGKPIRTEALVAAVLQFAQPSSAP